MKRSGLLLLVFLLLSQGAVAHAVLGESEPPGGKRLDEAPGFVRIVLTEAVDPSGTSLQVRNQDGIRVDNGDLVIDRGTRPVLTVTLPADLPDGAYAARWTALSTVDGHTTFGTVGFAVGGYTPPDSHAGDADALDVPSGVSRALAFIGLALLVGSIVYPAWDARILAGEVARRIVLLRTTGAGLHAAGVLGIVLDGAADNGLSLQAYASTQVGTILTIRLLIAMAIFVLALVWHRRAVAAGPWLLLAGAAAASVASARLGHADGPTALVVDTIHLLSSALWVGALATLFLALRGAGSAGLSTSMLGDIGRRFGTLASVTVAAIVVTGSLLTFQILGPAVLSLATWTDSAWSLLLVLKWVGLGGMLALALRNRRLYVHGDAHGMGAAHPGFPRTVAMEACLGAAVLLLAGLLTSVGAPQTDAEPAGATFPLEGDDFRGTLRIAPTPALGATSKLTFFLQSDDGPLLDPACGRDDCLTLEVGTDAGAQTYFPQADGSGFWSVDDVIWTVRGNHTVRLDIQTADVYRDVLEATVPVP